MPDSEISAAYRYHQVTKHTPESVRSGGHFLDWQNRPAPFKTYPGLDPIPLPAGLPATGMPAIQALNAAQAGASGARTPELPELAHLLFYSAGITKKLVHRDGVTYFRAAACAGALYPIEVYLICRDLSGLEAGVYHFSPAEFALRQLRAGEWLPAVALAAGNHPGISQAPAVLALTAITWRSTWKYQARAYRYHFWDAGTILANALAAAHALGLPARVVLGFVDREIDRLLGIDGRVEKSICLVPLGSSDTASPPFSGEIPQLSAVSSPHALEERIYAPLEAFHQASSLTSHAAVRAWQEAGDPAHSPDTPKSTAPGWPDPNLPGGDSGPSIEGAILRRGSSRRFELSPISSLDFSRLLAIAGQPFPSDWRNEQDESLNRLYLNAHGVADLHPGSYFYQAASGELTALRRGQLRGDSAFLCLEQPLGGEASFTVYFLADLERTLRRYGNRGYRAAQLEAGIMGGRLYLAAYALGLGATGLTFYDDRVVEFFAPHSRGMEAIFVTACGRPQLPPSPRGRIVRLRPGEAEVLPPG